MIALFARQIRSSQIRSIILISMRSGPFGSRSFILHSSRSPSASFEDSLVDIACGVL
jgi:hypothetical protein